MVLQIVNQLFMYIMGSYATITLKVDKRDGMTVYKSY